MTGNYVLPVMYVGGAITHTHTHNADRPQRIYYLLHDRVYVCVCNLTLFFCGLEYILYLMLSVTHSSRKNPAPQLQLLGLISSDQTPELIN